MTTEEKVIKAKLGLLKLAEQLGNVSQVCKVMATPEIAFTASKNCMKNREKRGFRRQPQKADREK